MFLFWSRDESALRHVDLGWERESQFCVSCRVCCLVSGSSIDCSGRAGVFTISSFHCWLWGGHGKCGFVWLLVWRICAQPQLQSVLFGYYIACGFNLLRREIRWTDWPVMRWSSVSVCIDVFGMSFYNYRHLLHLFNNANVINCPKFSAFPAEQFDLFSDV